MKDPYEVLGIPRNASDDEVKRAYRELSRKYHPDTYANNPLSDLAEDKFKEIQEAYHEIMDMRSGNGQNYSNGYGGAYGQDYGGNYGQGNQNYGQGYGNNPYGNPYNQGQYRQYGSGYGRNTYGGGGCGTGNLCCDLWCADTLCECMGGDLCSCF